jgi:hypothetical protein
VSRHICLADSGCVELCEELDTFTQPPCLPSAAIPPGESRRASESGSGGSLSSDKSSTSAELHLLVSADIEAECKGGRSIAISRDIRRWKELLLQVQHNPKISFARSLKRKYRKFLDKTDAFRIQHLKPICHKN